MVIFDQVTKRFGDLLVLDQVSLQLERGRTTCILGSSGAGKTVMLKLMVGLLKPDQGRILINGRDLQSLSPGEIYALRLRMGMLFQDGALFDSLSVYENIAFPLRYHRTMDEASIARSVAEKLVLVGLPGVERFMPSELSGGMRKRVGLARALMLDPELILFDEPNSGLDPLMADAIDTLILDTKRTLGITFFINSHDIVGTFKVADTIGLLSGNRLVEFAPTALFRQSAKEEVRRFLLRDLSACRGA